MRHLLNNVYLQVWGSLLAIVTVAVLLTILITERKCVYLASTGDQGMQIELYCHSHFTLSQWPIITLMPPKAPPTAVPEKK